MAVYLQVTNLLAGAEVSLETSAIPGGALALLAVTVPPSVATMTKGTFVLNGATPVTVAQALITAASAVVITLKTIGGTLGAQPHILTITPGTGFTIAGTALDTSTYNYLVVG